MTVADRWFYFPLIGLLGLSGVLIEDIHIPAKFTVLLIILSVSILIVFSVRTVMRNTDWRDEISLYEHDITLLKNANSGASVNVLEHDLITQLVQTGRINEAEYYALDFEDHTGDIDTLNTLGIIYAKKNEYAKARYWFTKAIQSSNLPVEKTAYENTSKLFLLEKNNKQAESTALVGIKKFPNDPVLWQHLGLAQIELGLPAQATVSAQKVYQLLYH